MARTKESLIGGSPGSSSRKQKSPKKHTPAKATSPKKKPERKRPGIVALKEIRRYQKTTELLIRRLPFSRLVREVQLIVNRVQFKWTGEALLALQEAAEAHLIGKSTFLIFFFFCFVFEL